MPRKGGVPQNLVPFKKGESGNPAGRPKLPDINEAMQMIMGEQKDGKTALDAILAALRAKAAKGDIRAAEVLLNRGYGLPKQQINVSGQIGVTLNEQETDPQDEPITD